MRCHAPRTPAPVQAKADSSRLFAPARPLEIKQQPEGERPTALPAGPGAGFSLADVPVHAPSARAADPAGLPEPLKAGVERLSGFAMDDVRVHRDSPEPARLGALAFAQGGDIHLGRGQERHLPHEAWHVVQQMQGRVAATTQTKGLRVNEDQGLEDEADSMSSSLGARCFADAPVQTTASGKTALAAPEAMSESVTGSDHPTQLQKREKNPLQPPTDPNLELLAQKFQQNLRERRLNEEINGGAAKALASAYLSSRVRSPLELLTKLGTSPVGNEEPIVKPPTFEETYDALLEIMHIAGAKDLQDAGVWKWTPARKEGKTRRGTEVEIIDWAAEQGIDNIKDEIRDKVIKTAAVEAAATWRAAQGLEVVAEILLEGLNVVGRFTLAISILQLLILLKKPVEKAPSRREQIQAGVISWLKADAWAAEKAKSDAETSSLIVSHSYRDNVKVGGVEDRVKMKIDKWEKAKAKEAATSRNIKAFESFQKSPH